MCIEVTNGSFIRGNGWSRSQALISCFIQKIYAPSSSLLQSKHLHFSPSPLRLNIFRLFVILWLTQLYRYTPAIFLFSTATFKYAYRAPLRRIGQEYSANVAWSIFQSLKRIGGGIYFLNETSACGPDPQTTKQEINFYEKQIT
jgi:hypothetical protein